MNQYKKVKMAFTNIGASELYFIILVDYITEV